MIRIEIRCDTTKNLTPVSEVAMSKASLSELGLAVLELESLKKEIVRKYDEEVPEVNIRKDGKQ